MDVVLGVSMTPSAVQRVLVAGESADGVTVDQDGFGVDEAGAPERVLSVILEAREGAREGGCRLTSTGVTVSDQVQAGLLRDALAECRIDGVMLVSAFLAAAALAQTVGGAIGYARTALLFVEPDRVTSAVVDSANGAISDVRRAVLPAGKSATVAAVTAMAASLNGSTPHPDGVFLIGSEIDVGVIKPVLEAATTLPVNVPEEPESALARGAALASAHAPLFSSSTQALAWARDLGTGAFAYAPPYVPGSVADHDATAGEHALAYSAVGDNDPDSGYLAIPDGEEARRVDPWSRDFSVENAPRGRKPFLLAGSSLASLFVIGAATLVIALTVNIRPAASDQPPPSPHVVVPTQQAPVPKPEQRPATPAQDPPEAPAPVPSAPAEVPAPPVHKPVAQPAPAPQAPAPEPPAAKVPEPAVPAPEPPAPVAPAPVPAPAPIPVPALAPIPIPIVIPAPAAPKPANKPATKPANKPEAPPLPPIFTPPKQSSPKQSSPKQSSPKQSPPIFSPPKQNPPKSKGPGNWLPGWLGGGSHSGGSHSGGGFPGFGGGHSGGGHGGGFPGFGGGHGFGH